MIGSESNNNWGLYSDIGMTIRDEHTEYNDSSVLMNNDEKVNKVYIVYEVDDGASL